MTIRLEILDFISVLQNEVQMLEVDPEASNFEAEPEIVEKFRATIAVLERLFPMIQVVDEILLGDISPKLFWKKWEKIKVHFEYPDDDDVGDVGTDVTNFLGKFDKGESA